MPLYITATGPEGRMSLKAMELNLGACGETTYGDPFYASLPSQAPEIATRVFAAPFGSPDVLSVGLELAPGLSARTVVQDAPPDLKWDGPGLALAKAMAGAMGRSTLELPTLPRAWAARINAGANGHQSGFDVPVAMAGLSAAVMLHVPEASQPQPSIQRPAPAIPVATPPRAFHPKASVAAPAPAAPVVAAGASTAPAPGALKPGAQFVVDGVARLSSELAAGKITPIQYRQRLAALSTMGGY
jgi:hypothetical protein